MDVVRKIIIKEYEQTTFTGTVTKASTTQWKENMKDRLVACGDCARLSVVQPPVETRQIGTIDILDRFNCLWLIFPKQIIKLQKSVGRKLSSI